MVENSSIESLSKPDVILDNLVSSLDSSNKDVRIKSSKSIYILSEKYQLSAEQTIKLCDFIADEIIDVKINATLALLNTAILLTFKTKSTSINNLIQYMFEYLCLAYMYDEFFYETIDYGEIINKKILLVILNACKNYELQDHVFNLLNYVLYNEEIKEQVLVLNIFYNHSIEAEYELPENSLLAVQAVLNNLENESEKWALDILAKAVRNGFGVNYEVLKIFNDRLFHSDVYSTRSEAFELLDKANSNQDLPDDIFQTLEMERAGYEIDFNRSDKAPAMSYILEKTKNGVFVTINVFDALIANFDDETVRSIVLNITSNRQHLPAKLIQKIEENFEPKELPQLTKTCSKIAENNQQFSENFLKKLENYVEDKSNQNNGPLFALFVQLEQKMEFLTKETSRNVFQQFLYCKSVEALGEMSGLFVKLIKNFDFHSDELVKKCLIKGLEQDNEHINFNCIKSLQTDRIALDSELENALVVLSKRECGQGLRESLGFLIKSKGLTQQKISFTSDVKDLSNNTFNHISSVLADNQATESKKVELLELMANGSNLIETPNDLLKEIISCLEKTSSLPVITACCKVFQKLKLIDSKAFIIDEFANVLILHLAYNWNQSEDIVQSTLLEIKANGYQLPELSQLVLEIFNIEKCKNFGDLFKRVNKLKMRKADFPNEFLISRMVNINFEKNFDLINFLNYTLAQNPMMLETKNGKFLANLIEDWLSLDFYDIEIVKSYLIVIQTAKFMNINKTLGVLAQIFESTLDIELEALIIECISAASLHIKLDEKYTEIFERNLENESGHIRRLCFQGLKNIEKNKILEDYCAKLKPVFKLSKEQSKSMDLMETLVSVDFIDAKNFQKNLPDADLIRILLLNDLLAKNKASIVEKFEVNYECNLPNNVISLLHQRFCSYPCFSLNEFFLIAKNIDIGLVEFYLKINYEPILFLKKGWLRTVLPQKFSRYSSYSDIYISRLIQFLSEKFEAKILIGTLNKLNKIECLESVEGLFRFVHEQNIDLNGIKSFNNIDELRASLEVQFLIKKFGKFEHLDRLEQALNNLFSLEWKFDQLNSFLAFIKSEDSNQILCSSNYFY